MARVDRHNWMAEYGDLLSPSPRFHAFNDWVDNKDGAAYARLAYNREDNDCGVRALAVACAAGYDRAHWALRGAGRLDGESCFTAQMMAAAADLRCHMVRTTCKAKTLLTVERELSKTYGGFIVTTDDHAVGIWDGELIDHARGRRWRVDGIYRVEPLRSER